MKSKISIKLFKSFEQYINSMQSYGFPGLYLTPYKKNLEICGVPASTDRLDAILLVPCNNHDRWPSIRLTFPRHEHTMFKVFLQNRLCAAWVYVYLPTFSEI